MFERSEETTKEDFHKPKNVAQEHEYGVLVSPSKLKQCLLTVNEALESYQKRLKLSQRSRQLVKKVKSMESLIQTLKDKNFLSQQAAENLSASFSGGALELIKRCMNKGKYSEAVYPAELRAFALTLQFYLARAYEYVRQTFNNCLPHPKTLNGMHVLMGIRVFMMKYLQHCKKRLSRVMEVEFSVHS